MMKETVEDAHCPCPKVESGTANDPGIPNPQPIPPRAGGGARAHRVVRSFRPAGQGNRRPHGDYTEKSFPLAQAFPHLGVAGLEKDAPRPGRKPKIGPRLRKRVVTLTTRHRPTNATHWSTRTMAAAVGIS